MKRFIHAHTDGVWEDENGQWVLYEEAQAEHARLRRALEDLIIGYDMCKPAIDAAREIIREAAALHHRD